MGLAVAAALSHAHAHNVLHRDVKADNILFAADGTVKVGDFGIAKLFEGSAATASKVAGTPIYMAPEQIKGGRLGPATDLYALSIVLYQLLAGRPPFDPRQPLHILWHRQLTEPAPPMAGVPAPVARVVLHALEKEQADRHPDAAAFARALARATATAYGAGWIARAGLPLHLEDAVRRAAEQPPATEPPTDVRTLTAVTECTPVTGGRLGTSESAEDGLARLRRIRGLDHPDAMEAANNLAVQLSAVGSHQAARELDADTLARRRRVLGPDHPDHPDHPDTLGAEEALQWWIRQETAGA